MSIPYELTGRRQQKARTREALIDATRELLADGCTPTVEQAATAASISRTTAYRYFPNQRALLAAAHPEIDARSLLGDDAPEDPEERFVRVVEAFTRLVVDTELQQRTTLRLSLEPGAADHESPLLRQGRAIGWLHEALAPLRHHLPEDAARRLVLATRATCGIEALVWLTDVAGLSRARRFGSCAGRRERCSEPRPKTARAAEGRRRPTSCRRAISRSRRAPRRARA